MAAAAIFGTVEERNRALSDLAASDAFHDFNTMSRLSQENKALGEKALDKIWTKTREIGTLHTPTAHEEEERAFERAIGKPLSDFRKLHKDPMPLTVLAAGKQSIEYEWQAVEVQQKVGGGVFEYTDSAELFKAITGGGTDPLYFMIDAINVGFHKALLNDKGSPVGKAVYITTRERTNDSASNRDMSTYVANSHGKKVRLEVLRDESDVRAEYPVMAAGSTEPMALFNSIYTLSLENKTTSKTKEGLESSILTFKKATGTVIKTVTSQSGIADHGNSINSLYERLVKFLKKISKIAGGTDDYFVALQQKRSGDWLQVLSTFQRGRYDTALEAGVPIFLASEDRLCVLYGLLVGANMIYTFQQGEKGYITIFRRKQKRTAAERAAERLEAYQGVLREILGDGAESLERAPIVPGGLPFTEAVGLYLGFMSAKIGEFSAAATKAREAALAIAAAAPGQRFNPIIFDAGLKAALLPLYTLVLFVRAFPVKPLAIADVSLTLKELNKTRLNVGAAKIDAWRAATAILRGLFATAPTALNSADEFRAALAQLYTVFETSNRDAHTALNALTAAKPLYEQSELALIQQIAARCPQSLLAPLQPLFAAMVEVGNRVLAEGGDSEKRKRATTLRMNGAILEYLLLAEVTNFPAAAIPSFSALLAKTFERPAATKPKGNLFAVHRILAASYKNFVQSGERKNLIETFLKVYRGASGGARSRSVAAKTAAKTYKKSLVALSRLFSKTATRRRSASTSLERKYARAEDAPAGKMSSLLPLYLVAYILEDLSFETDTDPYGSVPHLQGILAGLLDSECIARAHKELAPATPIGLFLGFYAEVVAYFVFVGLPNVLHSEVVARLFAGYDLLDVDELGRILRTGVLGDTAIVELEEGLGGELVAFLEKVLALRLPDKPGGNLRRNIVVALRNLEGYEQKAVRTSSKERSVTRRKKTGAKLVEEVLAAKRSRMKTISRKATARVPFSKKPLPMIHEESMPA